MSELLEIIDARLADPAMSEDERGRLQRLREALGDAAPGRKSRSWRPRLQDTERRLSTLAALTGRGSANTHSVLAFAHGVFDRARSGRLREVDQQQLSEQFAQVRRGIERAWAEAKLLSDDPVLRTSAYEQLNGRLADRDTVEVKRTIGVRQLDEYASAVRAGIERAGESRLVVREGKHLPRCRPAGVRGYAE